MLRRCSSAPSRSAERAVSLRAATPQHARVVAHNAAAELARQLSSGTQARRLVRRWTQSADPTLPSVSEQFQNALRVFARAPIDLCVSQYGVTLFQETAEYRTAAFSVPLDDLEDGPRALTATLLANADACFTRLFENDHNLSRPRYTRFAYNDVVTEHLNRNVFVRHYVDALLDHSRANRTWHQIKPLLAGAISALIMEAATECAVRVAPRDGAGERQWVSDADMERSVSLDRVVASYGDLHAYVAAARVAGDGGGGVGVVATQSRVGESI